MNNRLKLAILALSGVAMFLADVSTESPVRLTLLREAAAIIGRPLTPFSYAGVARRTTRRVVAVEATAATSAVASEQAAAQQQAAAAPPPAAPPAAPAGGAPAVGTIVSALPAGCVSAPIGGVQYYDCAGVFYRPAFQGNNLVYVVQKPS